MTLQSEHQFQKLENDRGGRIQLQHALIRDNIIISGAILGFSLSNFNYIGAVLVIPFTSFTFFMMWFHQALRLNVIGIRSRQVREIKGKSHSTLGDNSRDAELSNMLLICKLAFVLSMAANYSFIGVISVFGFLFMSDSIVNYEYALCIVGLVLCVLVLVALWYWAMWTYVWQYLGEKSENQGGTC